MNINEKLSLKKKTVVVLNNAQMRSIQGGGGTSTGPDGFCHTMACATYKCDKFSSPWNACPATVMNCQ